MGFRTLSQIYLYIGIAIVRVMSFPLTWNGDRRAIVESIFRLVMSKLFGFSSEGIAMSDNTKLATLTPRQREIFEFLKDKILNRGYGPTVREIGNEFSIRSPNGVMCHLKALEKKGLISRESHMSRAIQLADKSQRATSIAMLGQVSSGSPLKAAKEGEVVDFMDVFGTGDHACVRISDDSFAKDGIESGDFVVVRKQETCRDGDSVLAIVNGRDATIRRYFTDPKGGRLESLTSSRKAVYSSNVTVIGVVVGVVRKF